MALAGWEAAYATHTGTLWQDEPIAILPETLALIQQLKLRTVLDIGCGDGRNLLPLAAAGLGCVGLDLSGTALHRAYERLRESGQAAILLEGDASVLPLPTGTIEAVTCFDVFGQLPDPARVVAEFHRVLVPGGLLALNAFTPGDSEFGVGQQISVRQFLYKNTLFRFFEEAELRDLLESFEFEILRFRKQSWIDPPHGDFRPYSHKHENWIVYARRSVA